MASNDIYVAKEGAMLQLDGDQIMIHKGQTRVRAGHKLLELYPDFFEPLTVQYEVTEDTSSRTRDTGRTDARKTAEAKPAEKPADEKPAPAAAKKAAVK